MSASTDVSSAPARCAVATANAGAMSSGFRTSRSWLSAPSARAASSTSFQRSAKVGLPMLYRAAIRTRPGTISLSSSSLFPSVSVLIAVNPVTFPPGRARLTASPVPITSPTDAITMGIVLVAFIDIETHQLCRQGREAFGAAIGRSILNDEASTLVISEFPETFAQGIEIGGVGLRGYCLQHTDAPGQLLRARRERPRGGAAEQRDELATAAHSITSSAVARSDGGTVSPSILAVCMLMTSSNLLD